MALAVVAGSVCGCIELGASSRQGISLEKWLRSPWTWSYLAAPVLAVGAPLLFRRAPFTFLFPVFWLLAMGWTVFAFLYIVPRWLAGQSIVKQFGTALGDCAPEPVIWTGKMGARFPLDFGFTNVSAPLVRVSLTDVGVAVGPSLDWMRFIPSLLFKWPDITKAERLTRGGLRLRAAGGNLILFTRGRGTEPVDLLKQHGVPVIRNPVRMPFVGTE